ncbi:UspA domain-containing protein [Emticicia oligotrophica DSM 17448]|uniref:UspA domain-containing protein n=1 Tax=Emticicia oligotrophica (strain DSM 17448 / CIP 109782 / MTCC 6937 / GPTSA100-15) TaxID=929562 RepID=A0ABN4AI19_EMTOG|nr:universal stress protein [Emticicia oligotrophica]AFK01559.1 UspA domain-containing protein [Emticicia oligotrophica DSM 17448]
MKKILVPTDFSPIANKAIEVAVTIARYNGAMIELLNVTIYPIQDINTYYAVYGASGISIDDAWKSVLEDTRKQMDEVIAKYPDIKIRALIDESSDKFVESVLNHNADLIVMGSNGADGFKEFFGGSNSEAIVRMASCPVLVVKGEKEAFNLKKVVLAIDFTHEKFLKKAMYHLPFREAELHFLFVDTSSKIISYTEIKEKMLIMANKLGITNSQFVIQEATTVEDGILEYTEMIGADLVVMYTHGRTGVSHFFKGSIAEDVVNHSNVPVFTYVED